MRLFCQCTAQMACEEAEETDPQAVTLTFACPDCHREVVMVCPADEAGAVLTRPVWTHQARSRLDRIPPFAWPAVQEEVETYATASGRRLITAVLVDEAQRKGTMTWTPQAERRLQNIPEVIDRKSVV